MFLQRRFLYSRAFKATDAPATATAAIAIQSVYGWDSVFWFVGLVIAVDNGEALAGVVCCVATGEGDGSGVGFGGVPKFIVTRWGLWWYVK